MRPAYIPTETYIYTIKKDSHKLCSLTLHGAYIHAKRHICTSKETYMYIKRDMYVHQKGHICTLKETYTYIKRDIYVHKKRHTCTSKETSM